jgi:hypothetical protein
VAAVAGEDVPVRRRLGYLLVWTVATAVTVSASWLGIRSALVGTAVSRVDPLSPADLRSVLPTATPPVTRSPLPSATSSPGPVTSVSPGASPAERWVAVPDGHGSTAYRRTFHVEGGTVTIVVGPRETKVLDAIAQPRYAVQQAPAGQLSVQVSFVSPEHTSRIYASWRDAPYAEITESVP